MSKGLFRLYNSIMIRGELVILTLSICMATIAVCGQFEDLELPNVQRTINLASHYPTETVKLTLRSNDDHISHFSYTVPLDYDSKITRIAFFIKGKEKNSLSFTKSVYIYNGESFAHYRIKLPFNLQIGEDVDATVQIVFLNRYVNLPQTISLNEDQRLQYQDSKFLVSPYKVANQRSIYKFARILEFDTDGQRKGSSEVIFSSSRTAPFTFKRHIVFGINNNPQVKFTEVEKVIEVSHWGNVAITENYKIVNTGPSLKGEFSRVAYGSRGHSDAKNSYKGLDFDLPYDIWGLFYRDQVGNITTSRAWRDESSNSVHVSLQPRFSLLGGWKSNWEIGYNFKTKGLLYHQGNKFQLRNIKLEYAMERIIAEQFRIKIILPHGAENVKIKIGGVQYDMTQVEVGSAQGYLDFEGKPSFTIDRYFGSPKDKILEVIYEYPSNNIYEKPVKLSMIIASFLLFAVFIKRFKLQAFENKKSE